MSACPLRLTLDTGASDPAARSLANFAQRSPEIVERFLDSLDSFEELFRVHVDDRSAPRTGELRIVLEPTDRLVNFLATSGAGDV